MKITIYTVPECEFSKKEKEYLKSKNLQFEEKNLEANKDFLTEMLAVSDNFAGTPVTKLEKDDGQSVVLKGFTQSEFDDALGFTSAKVEDKPAEAPQVQSEVAPPASTPVSAPQAATPFTDSSPPAVDESTPPAVVESPNIPTTVEPPSQDPSAQPPTPTNLPVNEPLPSTPAPVDLSSNSIPSSMPPPSVGQDASNPMSDEKLSSLLENLQSKANERSGPAKTDAIQQPPQNLPSIPDPKFG